jgi:hypothetical protein
MRAGAGQAKAGKLTGSCEECILRRQPPKKWPANARAKLPNPPRVVPPEPDSAEAPDDERSDAASPPKKLRDHEPPEPPCPPPEDDPRGGQAVLPWGNDGPAMPAPFGSQFSRGITAYAPLPIASVPITRSATCRERLTG